MALSQKGKTQLCLSSLPTSNHPPCSPQRSRFPAPRCQIYCICTCKQQPVPPAACAVTLSPGHHLDVHRRFKAFPPGVLSYQAPDSTLTTFHNLLNPQFANNLQTPPESSALSVPVAMLIVPLKSNIGLLMGRQHALDLRKDGRNLLIIH